MADTYVARLDKEAGRRLQDDLGRENYAFRPQDHAWWSARGPDTVVTWYRSGKLVVQGRGAEAFVTRHLDRGAEIEAARRRRVRGVGSDRLSIQGVSGLRGVSHRVSGDRIEAGTMLIAGLATRGLVRVLGVDPAVMDSTLQKLRECGAEIEVGVDSVQAGIRGPLRPVPAA